MNPNDKQKIEVLELLLALTEKAAETEEPASTTDEDTEYTEPDHPGYDANEHILQMIDQITVNTLSANEKLKLKSVKSLVLLEQIRRSRT